MFSLSISLSQSSYDQSESTGEGHGVDWAQNGQGSAHHLHAFSGDSMAEAAIVSVLMEVAASAAGGTGWEGVDFLAAGVLNFDMSNLLTVSFLTLGLGQEGW